MLIFASLLFFFHLPKAHAQVDSNNWQGTFYPNKDLTGTGVSQTYDQLNFYWSGSPVIGIPSDQFSAVFEKQITVSSTRYYKFYGKADDGARIYIDGVKEIDVWKDGVNYFNTLVKISAGTHTIKVEYYDNKYSASLNVNIEKLNSDTWTGTYYSTKNLSGASVDISYNDLDFYWSGSPVAGLPSDDFSAIFDKQINVENDTMLQLNGKADDGARIYIDGVKEIDVWKDGVNYFGKFVHLTPGVHSIRVEYYDHKYSSSFFLNLKKKPIDKWNALFYSQPNLTGTAVDSSFDNLNLYWSGSPVSNIPSDQFSAIFEKQIQVNNSSFYNIKGKADDGAKIYVDGKLLLNFWKDGVNYFNKTVELSAGTHTIRVEYYDSKYSASLSVDIKEVPKDKWNAVFYSSQNLGGAISETTYDDLDLYWSGSPAPGIPSDQFSAVFEKQVSVDQKGYYQLAGRADDGAKVYVDGKLLVDIWKDGVNYFNKSIELSAGAHIVRVEYYDNKYSASLSVDIKDIPKDKWNAVFYSNQNLGGATSETTYDNLDFYWSGSPAPGIPSDQFSAIFEKQVSVDQKGYYQLAGRADDGAKVYVDGKLLVDVWKDGVNYFNKSIELSAGAHSVRVEYYDNKYSASLNVDIKEVPKDKWNAVFYSTQNLGGATSETTYDNLDFYWSGSPAPGIPSDHFSAIFEKQVTIDQQGFYQLTGRADDGVRIYVDGIKKLDLWQNGVNNFSKILNLSQGSHDIRVEYYDGLYSASFKMDMEQLFEDSWHATYYSNKDLTGSTVTKTSNDINFSWGGGSPDPAIPTDNFSAKFDKKMIVDKDANYQFSGRADDGIKILIDGSVVAEDHWKNGINDFNYIFHMSEGIHNVEIQYFDNQYSATLRVDVSKTSDPISSNTWRARYYSNTTFTGTLVETYEKNLNFAWGGNSPSPKIPTDQFSAIFEKKQIIEQDGTYRFYGRADDGIRVYIDGTLQINYWKSGVNNYAKEVYLKSGIHTIKVEYFDGKYSASVNLDFEKVGKSVTVKNTTYNYTLTVALNKQLDSGGPQTDKRYDTYVSAEYLNVSPTNPSQGTVNATTLNVRGGANTSSWIVGTVKYGDKLSILSKVKDASGDYWYKIKYNQTWVNASPTDVKYYLNPSSFSSTSNSYYQFLVLSESAGSSPVEVNQKILSNKGILTGKAQVFIDAAKTHHINEIYLISHALLETGNGTSSLANGVKVSTVDGKAVTPKVVYNMYGINATDSCPLKCGSEYAYKKGWFTPDAAIMGGAAFIANGYINAGQDTLYKMKWNPANPATHQYATDIGWAVKQTSNIYRLYGMLASYKLIFDVPKYN